MAKGVFITFEGGEGAGKSTQAERLKARLEETGKKVVLTHEPGGSEGAEAIRKLLVEGETHRWDPLTEVLLFSAARRDHVQKIIKPALAKGQWVISDRFYDSTTAYQGYGQGVKLSTIDQLRRKAINRLKPDLTLLLDMPVEAGLARAAQNQRYERMSRDFHEKLRTGFLELASAEPERFKTINAAAPVETVESSVWEAVKKLL